MRGNGVVCMQYAITHPLQRQIPLRVYLYVELAPLGHYMSKLGLPYESCTLVWTKKLDKYSSVYPSIPTKKVWTFWN